MAFKKIFLQLPLNAQIYLSIISIIIITLMSFIFLSQVFTLFNLSYLLKTKKKYYYTMQQNIMQSNIYFVNLDILQYENLIKLLNYQLYLYLKDQNIFKELSMNNINKTTENISNKIKIITDPINDVSNDYSFSNNDEILYVYHYSKNISLLVILKIFIQANYLSYLNIIKGARTFRIPIYGDKYLIGEYIVTFSKYSTFISFNFSRIVDIYNSVEGNINKYLEHIRLEEEINLNYSKKIFDIYEKNELHFIDLMYKLKYNIFSDYKNIENESLKIDYIRNQSIYFQNVNFENYSTSFFDIWNPSTTIFQGSNSIIEKYIDFIFFQISSKISVYSIPFSHDSNKLISINLCYFFLLKQIIYLNITSNIEDIVFDMNFLDNIYNEISNKDNITMNDCKIEKYYPNKSQKSINKNNDFNEYYNLDYIYNSFIYLLNKENINSIIFENKFSYPNYDCLKDLYPYFFTFNQLDFHSFSFGDQITKMMEVSYQVLLNMRLFMVLCLIVVWIFLFIIFIIVISRVIKQVTEPIIRLTEIIDLSNINEKTINKNIFEYKFDDDINEFFLLCKKFFDGEINDNNFKNKENIEINSNNNMIVNNKMILDLIENQKSLNTVDKEIFLLKQANTNDIKNRRHRTNKSSSIYKKEKNSQGQGLHFNLMKVTSSKNNDNRLINSNEDLYSEVEDNMEANNMNYYENLLNLSDYVYNVREKDKNKNNNQDKLRANINHSSMVNASLVKLGSVSNISLNNKNDNEIKNIRKNCKYITYSWYIHAKKIGLLGND